MLIFYIALGVLAVLFLAAVALSAYLFRFACRRDGRGNEDENLERLKNSDLAHFAPIIAEGLNAFRAAEKEDVYITSRDGLKLHGYWFPHKDAKGTIVMVHGWRSRVAYDFSAIWRKYRDMGYNLLGVEQRALGKSEGKYICFGVKERFDLIDWVHFVNRRCGEHLPVIFSGISMGSSTVMFAIGNEELPKTSSARLPIADSPRRTTNSVTCSARATTCPSFRFCISPTSLPRSFAASRLTNATPQTR